MYKSPRAKQPHPRTRVVSCAALVTCAGCIYSPLTWWPLWQALWISLEISCSWTKTECINMFIDNRRFWFSRKQLKELQFLNLLTSRMINRDADVLFKVHRCSLPVHASRRTYCSPLLMSYTHTHTHTHAHPPSAFSSCRELGYQVSCLCAQLVLAALSFVPPLSAALLAGHSEPLLPEEKPSNPVAGSVSDFKVARRR